MAENEITHRNVALFEVKEQLAVVIGQSKLLNGHIDVGPSRLIGYNGFRIWLEQPNDRIELCGCDWAPELGDHYRVIAARRESQNNARLA